MNRVEILHGGAAILASVLGSSGFTFVETGSGSGSGGPFAHGEFRRDGRRLQLHVRWSLGLVTYHVGTGSLAHAELTRAVAATQHITNEPEYPGFSQDPLDGFRHLGADLNRFGRVFTHGTTEEFLALIDWVRQHPKPTGLASLP